MMNTTTRVERRAFLALGASALLAGCVQDDTSGSDGSTTAASGSTVDSTRSETTSQRSPTAVSRTNTGTDDDSGLVQIDSNRSEPQATATVGDADRSDEESAGITVWNDAGTTRTISIHVRKHDSDTWLVDETYDLEPDAYVGIEVMTIGEHVVSVGLTDRTPKAMTFTTDTCNSQGMSVAVRPDGTVESSTMSTMALCMASVPEQSR